MFNSQPLRHAAIVLVGGLWCTGAGLAAGDDASANFQFVVRPILAKNCFACHGPDEAHREADLRLDVREVAVEVGAITPGSPDESELVRRISSDDLDERMRAVATSALVRLCGICNARSDSASPLPRGTPGSPLCLRKWVHRAECAAYRRKTWKSKHENGSSRILGTLSANPRRCGPQGIY